MPDPIRLQQQHLERTLVAAESSGDDEWARQVRDELKSYKKPRAKKADAAKADVETAKADVETAKADAEKADTKKTDAKPKSED